MPRKDLSLSEKIAILDKIKSQPPNTSHRQLAEITEVPKSTISRLLQQQEKLKEEWMLCEDLKTTSRKRKRDGKDPDVEDALNQWFAIVTEQGVRVNGPMLKTKSEDLAKKLGHVNFKATDGWLSRWKRRHDISLKKTHGKDSTGATAGEKWKSGELPDLFRKFGADETGLYFCVMPDGSLSYEHVTIGDDLQCHDEDYEETVIERIVVKHSEKPEDKKKDIPKQVTNQDAEKCISELRRYFMQEGNEDSPLSALDTCAQFVELQSTKRNT